MRRDISRGDIPYVSRNLMAIIGKIRGIGLLAIRVTLAGENTFAPDGFEAEPHSANPCKQVDEGESCRLSRRLSAVSISRSRRNNGTRPGALRLRAAGALIPS